MYNYNKENPTADCTSWGECDCVAKAPDWASARIGFSDLTAASFFEFVDELLDLALLQLFIWNTGSTSVPHILGV